MRHLTVTSLALVVLLNGCSSTISAWKNRPVAGHSLRPGRFFTLTGERRLAFQVDRAAAKNMAWCAESLPETSQAVTSSSKLTSQFSKNSNAGVEDAFGTTLTQTFVRTEIAEVYRQMSWQACQAWAQGVYSDAKYAQQLDLLLAAGIDIVKTRATQPLSAPAKSEPDAAASASKQQKAAKPDAATCKAKPATPGCETVKPADPAKAGDPQKAADQEKSET